jgi:hypothetical protein
VKCREGILCSWKETTQGTHNTGLDSRVSRYPFLLEWYSSTTWIVGSTTKTRKGVDQVVYIMAQQEAIGKSSMQVIHGVVVTSSAGLMIECNELLDDIHRLNWTAGHGMLNFLQGKA